MQYKIILFKQKTNAKFTQNSRHPLSLALIVLGFHQQTLGLGPWINVSARDYDTFTLTNMR